MKIQTMVDRAKKNKSLKASTYVKQSDITLILEYVPQSDGFEGQYKGNTFNVYLQRETENELIGGLFDDSEGVFKMWSDKHRKLVEGLTEVLEMERAYFDGNLEDNPVKTDLDEELDSEEFKKDMDKQEHIPQTQTQGTASNSLADNGRYPEHMESNY